MNSTPSHPPSASARPKVSVAMFTYNHERFIAQAIESVLRQQTDFPIELVIGEDCSTDGTRKIVEHFARLRPDVIRPLLHPRNLGPHANSRAVWEACRGEFIACLDGDDYWTDPEKLARQAAVLDREPRVALTWHALQLIDAAGTELNLLPSHKEAEARETLEQLVAGAMPGTPGVMVRRELLDLDAAAEFERFPQGDYPLWLLACRNQRLAHFSPRCMSVYRRHGGGATNTFQSPAVLMLLGEMWEQLAAKTGNETHPSFRNHVWRHYHYAAREYADQGQLHRSLTALLKSSRFAAMPFTAWLREYGQCLVRTCWRFIIPSRSAKSACL